MVHLKTILDMAKIRQVTMMIMMNLWSLLELFFFSLISIPIRKMVVINYEYEMSIYSSHMFNEYEKEFFWQMKS